MPEYIVDCEHVPYGEGRALVLPISVNGHVHERLVRCSGCKHRSEVEPWYCRKWHAWVGGKDGYCHKGEPKGGDG